MYLEAADGTRWPLSKVEEIARLQTEAGAGRCPFCERPMKFKPRARKPVVCFRADCVMEYHRVYNYIPKRLQWREHHRAVLREARRVAGLTARGTARKMPLPKPTDPRLWENKK
jgi:hypothetical protein